jgi:hypothetical protein
MDISISFIWYNIILFDNALSMHRSALKSSVNGTQLLQLTQNLK